MSEQSRRALVSVVIPMLDELRFIDDCLDGFAAQTYPTGRIELVIVDGGSTDGSRERVAYRAQLEPWIRLIENPDRRASSAFNRGVEAATGEIVCLFSSHGVPATTYVERSVDILTETGAAGVGGRYHHVGTDRVSNAIGLAMVSPFGMASPHRFALGRRQVDTISHPAYRRDALVDTGAFDESLMRNSDYELNYRMRLRGHRLFFDPGIESIYRPRSSLRGLGRQFWHYGRWKARVAKRHPGSLRPRHLVAPAAVVFGAVSPALLFTDRGRSLCEAAALGYGVATAVAVACARPRQHAADPFVVAASFPVMHVSWGAGFLLSFLSDAIRWKES